METIRRRAKPET
jgi:hypothetical protein